MNLADVIAMTSFHTSEKQQDGGAAIHPDSMPAVASQVRRAFFNVHWKRAKAQGTRRFHFGITSIKAGAVPVTFPILPAVRDKTNEACHSATSMKFA